MPKAQCPKLTMPPRKRARSSPGSSSSSSDAATAEAYDPQQNRWEAVAPMASARHSCAADAI